MDNTSGTKRRRQERIQRAVRELTQAIEHGDGVDLALDHLVEATGDGSHRSPRPTAAA